MCCALGHAEADFTAICNPAAAVHEAKNAAADGIESAQNTIKDSGPIVEVDHASINAFIEESLTTLETAEELDLEGKEAEIQSGAPGAMETAVAIAALTSGRKVPPVTATHNRLAPLALSLFFTIGYIQFNALAMALFYVLEVDT